jgi:hypothetical protein
MKSIKMEVKFNENGFVGITEVEGFDKDSAEGILLIAGVLDNMKLKFLNKLEQQNGK